MQKLRYLSKVLETVSKLRIGMSAERHKLGCLRSRRLAGCTERLVGLKMAP